MMKFGLDVEMVVPAGHDPREHMIKTLYAMMEILETTPGHVGLPLAATLRDKSGLLGAYRLTGWPPSP